MPIFDCLKWPEMRAVARDLIERVHEGHAQGRFSIPVVDFVGVFSPGASERDRERVAARGRMEFAAETETSGKFALAEGPLALLDLGREGLVMRIPARMSGRYELRPAAFRVIFNEGEELEGCKRLVLLVCKRVVSVDISQTRVDVRLPSRFFDLCVEFD
jgi:hypothetical protein